MEQTKEPVGWIDWGFLDRKAVVSCNRSEDKDEYEDEDEFEDDCPGDWL